MMEITDTTSEAEGESFLARCRKLLGAAWLPYLLAVVFVGIDQFSGPYLQFPATFVIPVALAAWYGTRLSALALAIGQPALNLAVTIVWHPEAILIPPTMIVINTVIRASVLAILAYFICRTALQNRELARRVGLLRGEIPICFNCHKAQDEAKNWVSMEIYVARHTEAAFTDSLCESCAKTQFKDITATS